MNKSYAQSVNEYEDALTKWNAARVAWDRRDRTRDSEGLWNRRQSAMAAYKKARRLFEYETMA